MPEEPVETQWRRSSSTAVLDSNCAEAYWPDATILDGSWANEIRAGAMKD